MSAPAAGAFSLLLVASLPTVPLFGALIAPLGAIPVLHYQASGRAGIRVWGRMVGLLLVAVVTPIGATAGLILASYLFVVVLPSVTVERWLAGGWPAGRWVAITAGVAIAASIVGVAAIAWPEPPQEAALKWIRAGVEETLAASPEAFDELGEVQLDLGERIGSWIVPSVPIAYLLLVLFWIRPRLPLLGFDLSVEPFEDYRSEEWLPAAFAAAGAGTLLLAGTPRWVAVNVLVAVLMLYFAHGLAIIRAHLARVVGRQWFVRWGVALLCLMWPMPPLVSLMGLTDSFWDLRPRADDDGGR